MPRIESRRLDLASQRASKPYAKQKTSLELEFTAFLGNISPRRTILSATPHDVIRFLIWKDQFGKTTVHEEECRFLGQKTVHTCACPRRLAYGTVDSLIGKLRAVFAESGRCFDDSLLPGYGNPAASREAKEYFVAVREEQLLAKSLPSQAEPLFLRDLKAVSDEILSRLRVPQISPSEIFVLVRDQAFLKIQFFGGDRAGDLEKLRSSDLVYLPNKEGFLFNHSLTKSLRDGTSNLFALKRFTQDSSLCPISATESYIAICESMGIALGQGFRFRPLNAAREVVNLPFTAKAAQARLSFYAKQLPNVFTDKHPTLHGLRSGCAISLAVSETNLSSLMDHIGWKCTSTAQHYIKLNQVLSQNGPADLLARLTPEMTDKYRDYNNLFGFEKVFP